MKNLQQQLHKYIQEPLNPECNFGLGYEYEKIGQNASALSYYLRCAELSEDRDLVYECLLKSWYMLNKTGRREWYEHQQLLTAITQHPKRPEAYFLLSRLHEAKREWKECFYYASVGLELCDFSLPDLRTDVDYPGEFALKFQKAFASWYVGQRELSKELWIELSYRNDLHGIYEEVLYNNLINFNLLDKRDKKVTWHEPLEYLQKDHNRLKLKFKDSDKIEKNYSQCYQDLFVLFCTEGKKDGKYLEVGAGRPFYGNNTALLSKLGWKGVSIDLDKSLVDLWHKERPNDKCILEDATQLDYSKLVKDSNLDNYIDYLQLDIDPAGNTFKVLEKIPFDNIEFGIITYEHDFYDDKNPKWRNKSREVLKEKGYTLIAANISPDENSPYEDWWVNTKYINDKVLKNIVNTSSNVLYAKNYIINSNNLLYSKK